MNSQARFPDGHRLLFPVKLSQVREVGLAEAKLDTSVVLSHGVWTGTSTFLLPNILYCENLQISLHNITIVLAKCVHLQVTGDICYRIAGKLADCLESA